MRGCKGSQRTGFGARAPRLGWCFVLCAGSALQAAPALAAPGSWLAAAQLTPAAQWAQTLSRVGAAGPMATRPEASIQALFAKGQHAFDLSRLGPANTDAGAHHVFS